METSTFAPARQVSHFMRPFALAGTAYLVTLNVLFMVTRGEYHSPDRWSDVYMLILAAYAGGAELAHLMHGTESEEEGWRDQIRKGGPLVTLWLVMLLAAGIWRIADDTRPMPPELKETAMKVVGVFFGAYTLRQYRRAKKDRPNAVAMMEAPFADPEAARLLDHLRRHGPQTPKVLSESLDIPRRSVARLLKDLTLAGAIIRRGGPFDPSAVYHIKVAAHS
jgi:hypothetical protein